MALNTKNIAPMPHHQQQEVCLSRARYRQGRKETSVKVYTIHQESRYLLIQGVPAIGVQDELEKSLQAFGDVVSLHPLHEYPSEQFTVTYLTQFSRLQSARVAKRKMDNRTWFGSPIHICYAPEYESLQDTRNKLNERKKYILNSLQSVDGGGSRSNFNFNRREAVAENLEIPPPPPATTTTTYIWAGKEYTIPVTQEHNQASTETDNQTEFSPQVHFVPRQLTSKRKTTEEEASFPSSEINSKLQRVAAPNLDVNFKRNKLKKICK